MAPGPIPSHSTETSRRAWSGPGARRRLGQAPARVLRRAHAWADPGGDPADKGTYKFIHHEVDAGGSVGAANVRACRSGIGVLNGARGGADIPAGDRKGIHTHLARHLRDAGEEPPALE